MQSGSGLSGTHKLIHGWSLVEAWNQWKYWGPKIDVYLQTYCAAHWSDRIQFFFEHLPSLVIGVGE